MRRTPWIIYYLFVCLFVFISSFFVLLKCGKLQLVHCKLQTICERVINACVNGNKQTQFLVFIEKFTNLMIYDVMMMQSKQNKTNFG